MTRVRFGGRGWVFGLLWLSACGGFASHSTVHVETEATGSGGEAEAPPTSGMAVTEAVMSAPAADSAPAPAEAPAQATAATASTSTTVTVEVRQSGDVDSEPVIDGQQVAPARLLTAASVGDADRRDNYLGFLARHPGEAERVGLDMTRRVRFRVVDRWNRPVNDARIELAGGGLRFDGRTHADGVWDYYPGVVAPGSSGALRAHVTAGQLAADTVVEVPAQGDGQDVTVRFPSAVGATPQALDLAFAIDVTGSMGDELRYVNREVGDIVRRVRREVPETAIRVGATFYRDRSDAVVVQKIAFTSDVNGFARAMQGVVASGGGDYPEDMNAGLDVAFNRLDWSTGPAARVLVLISDAPPQRYADEQFDYRAAMLTAARRGIRIVPVAASGADREVEYLFRAMGAFTSAPYVYLTDDSGIGNPHLEADTDRVGVEYLSDLLTRLLVSDLRGEGMHEPGPLGPAGTSAQQ